MLYYIYIEVYPLRTTYRFAWLTKSNEQSHDIGWHWILPVCFMVGWRWVWQSLSFNTDNSKWFWTGKPQCSQNYLILKSCTWNAAVWKVKVYTAWCTAIGLLYQSGYQSKPQCKNTGKHSTRRTACWQEYKKAKQQKTCMLKQPINHKLCTFTPLVS